MKTVGERMMMAFFQSQFVFAHRPWKVADPKSRDHMGVGAFNLVRREVYESIGTYQRLRLSVLDDMKLGELVKQHGYRQRNVFGRDLLTLRWVVGALGMVRNLTKNFFAIFRYNPLWAATAIAGMLLVNLGPFVGLYFAQGWARVGFVAALLSIFAIYVGMSRRSDISPAYFFLHPVGALLFGYAVARSMILTLCPWWCDLAWNVVLAGRVEEVQPRKLTLELDIATEYIEWAPRQVEAISSVPCAGHR